MINLIRQNIVPLFICALCIIGGFTLGELTTQFRLTPLIAQAERDLSDAQAAFVQAQRDAAELHNRALREAMERQRALYAINEQLTRDLQTQTDELTQARLEYDRSIANAIKNDGGTYTGLGPDGLRLYSAALGYQTPASDSSLPDITNGADSDTTPPTAATVRNARSSADARKPLRGVEPNNGGQAKGDPALAGQTEGVR